MRHMPTLLKRDPLHLLDPVEKRHNDIILSLVVASVEQEDRDRDFAKGANDGPVFQGPGDVEFGRAIPS